MLRFDVFTLFPGMFAAPLGESIVARATSAGLVQWQAHNIRDYATDKHHITDDVAYGGGGGMVMKAEPIVRAVRHVMGDPGAEGTGVLLMSPRGQVLTHRLARELSDLERIAIICGRYEGVDERVTELLEAREVSIGDYVLSGGELAAMVVIEAVARQVPGVLGHPDARLEDSHAEGLLEYPHYTRPAEFEGLAVPPVLLSGNHAEVYRWRRRQALMRTLSDRPELLDRARLDDDDRRDLAEIRCRMEQEERR